MPVRSPSVEARRPSHPSAIAQNLRRRDGSSREAISRHRTFLGGFNTPPGPNHPRCGCLRLPRPVPRFRPARPMRQRREKADLHTPIHTPPSFGTPPGSSRVSFFDIMNQHQATHEAPLSGDALHPRSTYGLPAKESQAASRFFAELRSHGRMRLACAAVGWRRAQVDNWKQPYNHDGTKNRHYSGEFNLAVEQAICDFQREVVKGIIQHGEDLTPSQARLSTWVLERFFDSEYNRAAPSARPTKPAR